MSLQEKLKQKESGLPSVTLKMKEIEQQNELLLFRMSEINELIEKSVSSSEKINENHEQQLDIKIMSLNDKINQIQQSNELLADSFRNTILQEMNTISHDLKRENDRYLQGVSQNFKKTTDEISRKTADLAEKKKKRNEIINNMQFSVTIIMYVAIAVVLIRALIFGIWEGLYIKNLYQWGSQWTWLKYTMIGAFIALIGYIGYFIYSLAKRRLP